MKAILEFQLPEDSEEHKMYLKAGEYHSQLWDISQFIRAKTKHGELTEGEMKLLDEIREIIEID